MSERIPTPRLAFSSLLALAFSASVMAQTAPAPKADAAKAPVKVAAAPENDPDVALAKKAALDWLALADAGKFEGTWEEVVGSHASALSGPSVSFSPNGRCWPSLTTTKVPGPRPG